MERLTKKVDGVWTALCNYGSSPYPVVTQEIIDRLAAYEDTGFTPEEVQQMQWIPVEKRLPEDDAPAGRKQITVMVTTKAGKVTIASRVFEPERDYCGKVYPARWLWSRWLNNHVTHWMELPAPPGKDNNVPTKAQNEPLTLEELREMEEPTPVWWKKAGCWCLCERGFIIAPNGNIYEFEETDRTFYRHPPEGEEEKP